MHKDRIKLALGITIGTCMMGTTFGYLEDQMYCYVKDNIKVSLKAEDGGKCKEYIKYLEQKMKQTYLDMLTVRGYIRKKQDVDYREPIRQEKNSTLKKLQGLRLDILVSMRIFEYNILKKSKELFLKKIKPHKKKLEIALEKIDALSGLNNTRLEKYGQLARDALQTMEDINNCKTFEAFSAQLKKYLYIKQQLEGNSEL